MMANIRENPINFPQLLQSIPLHNNIITLNRQCPAQFDKQLFNTILVEFEYDANKENTYNHNMCLICHEDFTDKENIRKVIMCNHLFHKKCIKVWYKKSPMCPICKQD